MVWFYFILNQVNNTHFIKYIRRVAYQDLGYYVNKRKPNKLL